MIGLGHERDEIDDDAGLVLAAGCFVAFFVLAALAMFASAAYLCFAR